MWEFVSGYDPESFDCDRVFCFLVCCKAPMATFQYGICICRIALEGVSRVFEFPRFKVFLPLIGLDNRTTLKVYKGDHITIFQM